jgi:DNA-binding MarR family transcriptional regulator
MSEVRKTTATQLARRLYLSTSTIVGILDRLENKNLITRTRNRGDRRVVYLRLTKDGKKVAATAPILLQDKLYKALLSLPELERATIALSLEKIVGLMDADKIDGAPIIDSGPLDQSEEEKALRPKSLENL